ncbi:MAG: hypothetical protein JJ908_05850 [Rhizobiales bacterium]|nr:hypothetical protein [Hyphomicrobiales bacterium]MBO6697871.1 hypothetical protein [Hyphomicrobiales bacterium]MBO6735875.1 hypothetical protein [Hyphomicrobiales bacterium]MBO6913886.1 hypothetical protein [Hyphomicrobiales bacterium]MBO6955589.1 hypothetical protein [Hyphomicrobiales bacterium]
MSYVSRRIRVSDDADNWREISDIEFAALDGPLILVGEPGSGKSDTASAICTLRQGVLLEAYRVASSVPLPQLATGSYTVIDGFDEVPASSAHQPIELALERLHSQGIEAFVITCRAADLAAVQKERAIVAWTGRKPVIGHLQPLNDNEVASVVEGLGTFSSSGDEFVKEAHNRHAIELARNPQSLRLLIAAIGADGWPSTRTEIYERACVDFVQERNRYHRSQSPTVPDSQELLSIAGFVCAQLLLGGVRGIDLDNQNSDDQFLPTATFAGGSFSIESIRSAASTLLFRSVGNDKVEPMHRTVAEYLAARWLVSAQQAGSLSYRRLESAIYVEGTVPTSLRGLHAWMATLHRSRTNKLSSHDPYGCLRYGDVSQFSDVQIRVLIEQLQDLAAIDPYFRGEDWDAPVAAGLVRHAVRDEVVQLISSPDVPFGLSSVVLQSLKGVALAASVREDLRRVVLNDAMVFSVRSRALEALEESGEPEDWVALSSSLSSNDTLDSARLAVEIIIRHPDDFSGDKVAEVVLNNDRLNAREDGRTILGIDFRLWPVLRVDQLQTAIQAISAELPSDPHSRTDYQQRVEDRVQAAVIVLLSKSSEPTASQFWGWVCNTSRFGYQAKKFDEFSIEYFSERPELRRAIQELVLVNAGEDGTRAALFRLRDVASGLTPNEDDVVYHMAKLCSRNSDSENLIEQWRELAHWAAGSSGFAGDSWMRARELATLRPELNAVLDEIENRPRPAWEIEEEKRQRVEEAKQRRRDELRRKKFADVADSVRDGSHLHNLHQIAQAYLGLFGEVREIEDPAERVAWLVGDTNLQMARDGLLAACQREDLPSPREMAELSVQEQKTYFLERIILAACAAHQASGHALEDLPPSALWCALAACSWGLYSHDDKAIEALQEQLEDLLLQDDQETEQFLRDSIEPALFASEQHVSGLHELASDQRFTKHAESLTLEWLENSERVSDQPLKQLLETALSVCDKTALSDLVARKLENDDFPSDEHKRRWMAAAFAVDFERFRSDLESFAQQDQATLHALRDLSWGANSGEQTKLKRSVGQLTFVITHYAAAYQITELPRGGWAGTHPYEQAQYIAGCINELGSHLTDAAHSALEQIVDGGMLGNHIDNARHVLAEHTRSLADAAWRANTLQSIRPVLLAGPPQTIDDLQSLVMSELVSAQERVRDGTFNSVQPFWNDNQPHDENYCRDRLAEHLEPYLLPYGVRVHSEGTMPDRRRCDLLCTIGELDLPIEIKGQWHPNLWNAACEQLEDNYARNYRSDGRGIYAVVWFGDVAGRNPPGIRTIGRPNSAADLMTMLQSQSPRPLNAKTQLFVLDVSQPI